jgi:hypothetical protein
LTLFHHKLWFSGRCLRLELVGSLPPSSWPTAHSHDTVPVLYLGDARGWTGGGMAPLELVVAARPLQELGPALKLALSTAEVDGRLQVAQVASRILKSDSLPDGNGA